MYYDFQWYLYGKESLEYSVFKYIIAFGYDLHFI